VGRRDPKWDLGGKSWKDGFLRVIKWGWKKGVFRAREGKVWGGGTRGKIRLVSAPSKRACWGEKIEVLVVLVRLAEGFQKGIIGHGT